MDVPEVEPEAAESAPQKRRGPWPLIVVVLVLTLIAVWLVPGESPLDGEADRETPPPSLLEEAPVVAPAPTPPEAMPEEPVVVETEPAPIIDDRPGAKARSLIAQMRASGDYPLNEVVAAATASQQAGEFADAYLLFFFAAREGHNGAAMTLGRQADPAHHQPGQSVFDSPDLIQAHKWYEAAAQSGDVEAQQALAELRERVEQLAANGDPAAQRIALMWQ